jgi:pectate lyase
MQVDLPLSMPGITYIQEDEVGFGAIDGNIIPRQASSSVTGYTGTGFADSGSGIGVAASWSVRAEEAGAYQIVWRYSFGGDAANLRDARLLVNGVVQAETVGFPYTNGWDQWQESVPLDVLFDAGSNFIQLQAIYDGGLVNIDYIKILGEGITPDTPSFSLAVDQNAAAGGTVSVSPEQAFYPAGTQVTLTAQAAPGYFFQSWTGGVTSSEPVHTFPIDANTRVTGLFLPEGTVQDPELVGYASVQDDEGTPFIVTGGSLGQSVQAATLDELAMYLERPEPYVVSFEGELQGDRAIHITSDKTLLGIGSTAHLRGIELEINAARNVIIRNLAVSHVIAEGAGEANDAIVVTGGSRNVWLDRLELFSDRENGEDYYDGLLEIKNAASYVTVSRSVFHDHHKVSLISSGDEQVGDTVIRATYHHNRFFNCSSRMPSIRFGKAHIFNNYYHDNLSGSGVNTRMGAVVRVENNYFQNSDDPIGSWDSRTVGFWDVSNNLFVDATGSRPTMSNGALTPPYEYVLDEPADVPAVVEQVAGVGKL